MSKKNAAFFDFDGTLIEGESLTAFLMSVAGTLPFIFFVLICLVRSVFKKICNLGTDFKTDFKAKLLYSILHGLSADKLEKKAEIVFQKVKWRSDVLELFNKHIEAGDKVFIISGALDIYLPQVIKYKELKVNEVICTEMAVENNFYTGLIAGENCVREEKPRRIKAAIKKYKIDGKIFAYGDSSSDVPMFNLADEYLKV